MSFSYGWLRKSVHLPLGDTMGFINNKGYYSLRHLRECRHLDLTKDSGVQNSKESLPRLLSVPIRSLSMPPLLVIMLHSTPLLLRFLTWSTTRGPTLGYPAYEISKSPDFLRDFWFQPWFLISAVISDFTYDFWFHPVISDSSRISDFILDFWF